MARDVLAGAKAKVVEHKDVSGGFEDNDELTFMEDYAVAASGACIIDVIGKGWSTAGRFEQFSHDTMTNQEKADTKVDQINVDLYASYKHADSMVLHSYGGLPAYGAHSYPGVIFRTGYLYWIPSASPNTGDFETFQRLFERRMAKEYIDVANNSTGGEIASATADYENYRDNVL